MVGSSNIPLFRGFDSNFFYKKRFELVRCEIEKLKIEEDNITKRVAEEVDSGRAIFDNVLRWQKEVEEIQQSAEEFGGKCTQRLSILDPIARFKVGKEAAHMAKQITQLSDSGKEIHDGEIAYVPPVVYMPSSCTEFQDFESRKDAYEKLWEALVSEDSPAVLGIYGMPGVGKTIMMEQILVEVMQKGIFNQVARAIVGSGKLDVINIQNQIARCLDIYFESQDNVDSRASQLKNGLINGGKTLILFDDVWMEIPLYSIGIPFGDGRVSRGSKILFTSREKTICFRNYCKYPVMIATLTPVESWDLFSNIVSTPTMESLQDETLAKNLCYKCGGVPLVIHAIGKALKFESTHWWMDTLNQLEDCQIEKIIGIDPAVYYCFKLSFDKLVEDAKICLLLCSMFPEDADIHIWNLIQLATGSQLVHGGRSRVLNMVDILESSLLLLQGKDDQHVKLHTLIRSVARSIAVSDPKYAFLSVRCGSRLPHRADYGIRKLLHLDLEANDFNFPDDLSCPDLHTLSLQSVSTLEPLFFSQKFQDLVRMFVNLRFLVLKKFCCKQQFSLRPLSGLRWLLLDRCNLFETDVRFFPQNIESLIIWDCHLPEKLDLSELKYLRKLEILGGTAKVSFVPNTISSLSSLEELHISNELSILDDKGLLVPVLFELSKLTRLKSLQICFSQFEAFPETNIFDNLHEFTICVGRPRDYKHFLEASSRRLIELSGYQLEGFEDLVERAAEVSLRSTNIRVSSIWNSNREAFADLRNLYIEECNAMEYVAYISQDEIQQSLGRPAASFSNLTILEIRRCSAIKYLFSNSVAMYLGQLKQLCIIDCPLMEAIIMNENKSDGDTVYFYNLKSLKLCTMPRLASFYMQKKYMHSSSTSITDNSFQPLFDGTAAFPSLEVLELSGLEHTADIWAKVYHNDDNVSSFCKLKSLKVSNFNRLEIVIPVAMFNRLQNLESLHIIGCNSLISEVGTNHNNTEICQLVALSQMHLEMLPCLVKTGLDLCDHSRAITLYPNLSSLYIRDCSSLINVFQTSIARVLVHLKEMRVSNCAMMKEIIGAGDEEITCDVLLTTLEPLSTRLIELSGDDQFECFEGLVVGMAEEVTLRSTNVTLASIRDRNREAFAHLRYMHIEECHNLKYIAKISDDEIKQNLQRPTSGDEIQESLQRPISFSKLTILYIGRCSEIKYLFCGSIAKCLLQLQQLSIYDCPSMEVIVMNEGTAGADIINFFSKLQSLKLRQLPRLTSFYKEYKHVHSSSKYECLMPALVNVEVENCGLSSLFTSNVLENLQQLQQLKILNCASFEEIVEDGRGDEPSYMDKKIITLSQLKSVILKNLATLKSFIHSTKYEYLMPALVNVEVENCGLSSLFTSNVFKNLQKLQELKILNCALLKEIVEDGRGDEPSYMEDKTITLSQLESVVLKDLQKLKSFMHSAEYVYQMPALLEVEVENCGLSSLFTSNVFKNLQHLRQLKISNCASLKEIVEDGRGEPSYMDKKSITLPQLESVILKDLEKLKSFMHSAEYVCQMPALLEVEVDNCGLFTLFTSNVFKNLQKLRELRVSNCIWLEDIVAEVRDDETFYKSVSVMKIPRLSTIILNNLPKLKCFSRAAKYAFEMHALYTLRLSGCPLVEHFTSNETSTGLVSVYTDWQDGEEVSNLNDYIKQNCRRLGSPLSNSAGESSSSYKPDKEAVRVEEEQPLQETVASDQKVLKIELQIYINSQQEVTNTKTSVHHLTLLE